MSSDSAAANHRLFALTAAAAWVVLFALYLLFAGSFSLDEAATGAAAATLACLWWALGGRRGGMRFAGWTRHLGPHRQGDPRPARRDGAGGGATRPPHPLRPPAGPDPLRAGRRSAWAVADTPAERALGLIAKSLAPDSFVLREKGGDAGIVEHRLSGGGDAR